MTVNGTTAIDIAALGGSGGSVTVARPETVVSITNAAFGEPGADTFTGGGGTDGANGGAGGRCRRRRDRDGQPVARLTMARPPPAAAPCQAASSLSA